MDSEKIIELFIQDYLNKYLYKWNLLFINWDRTSGCLWGENIYGRC